MLPLLLIDTRDRPPEPEPERPRRGGGIAAALGWLYPWPMVVLWLWLGGILLTGIPGMAAAVAALLVTFWRVSKYPHWGGLGEHRQ